MQVNVYNLSIYTLYASWKSADWDRSWLTFTPLALLMFISDLQHLYSFPSVFLSHGVLPICASLFNINKQDLGLRVHYEDECKIKSCFLKLFPVSMLVFCIVYSLVSTIRNSSYAVW